MFKDRILRTPYLLKYDQRETDYFKLVTTNVQI